MIRFVSFIALMMVVSSFFFEGLLADCNNQSACYLMDRIPASNCRYSSFVFALNLMKERQAVTLIETGTARNGATNCIGDGCSTVIFADWIRDHGAYLYSIDVDPQALHSAQEGILGSHDSIEFVCSDSITFLKNFNRPIDFLYLDSYDFEISNPGPSQQHHLQEIMAAYSCLHSKSIVMIDDCDLPHGGKGKFVIEFLLRRGWKIIYKNYQVILVQ